MYKAKKQFLYASIATAAIAGGLAFGSVNTTLTAHAAINNDTTNVDANNSQATVLPSKAQSDAQEQYNAASDAVATNTAAVNSASTAANNAVSDANSAASAANNAFDNWSVATSNQENAQGVLEAYNKYVHDHNGKKPSSDDLKNELGLPSNEDLQTAQNSIQQIQQNIAKNQGNKEYTNTYEAANAAQQSMDTNSNIYTGILNDIETNLTYKLSSEVKPQDQEVFGNAYSQLLSMLQNPQAKEYDLQDFIDKNLQKYITNTDDLNTLKTDVSSFASHFKAANDASSQLDDLQQKAAKYADQNNNPYEEALEDSEDLNEYQQTLNNAQIANQVIDALKKSPDAAQKVVNKFQQKTNDALSNYTKLSKAASDKKTAAQQASTKLSQAKKNLQTAQDQFTKAQQDNNQAQVKQSLAQQYQNKLTIAPITMTAGQSIPSPEAIVSDNKNASPKASMFVALATEAAELPTGTTVTWADPNKVTSDATKPGIYHEPVKVSFSDGSALLIPTILTVVEPATTPSTPSKGDSGKETPSNPSTPSKGHNQTNPSQGGKTTPPTPSKGQDKPATSNPSTPNKDQDKPAPSTPSNSNADHGQPSQPASTPKSNNDVTQVSHSQANDAVMTQDTKAATTTVAQPNQQAESKRELPQTGDNNVLAFTVLGALTAMLGLGLAKKREF